MTPVLNQTRSTGFDSGVMQLFNRVALFTELRTEQSSREMKAPMPREAVSLEEDMARA